MSKGITGENRNISPLRLVTARLALREWSADDIGDLVEGLNDLSVARWLAFVPHPYSAKEAVGWIQHCQQMTSKGVSRSEYEFAIELRSEKKVIGGMSIARVSQMQGTAGGGIWLSSKYQGHGYGSEAFGERARFAFEDLKLRRLENGFFRGNEASWAMQERLGYKIEGEKRKAYRCMADGELKDEIITGLLIEDWKRDNN